MFDTYEEALEAVKQNGLALEFVKEQSFGMCLEAVKQNANALAFVRDENYKRSIKEALGFLEEKYKQDSDVKN
jgi:hypothetical protein